MILRRGLAIATLVLLVLIVAINSLPVRAETAQQVQTLAHGDDTVVVRTPFGQIKLKLLKGIAPDTAALVHRLAKQGRPGCSPTTCKFYRNEARPTKAQDPLGPPYFLLQGSMNLDGIPPAGEGHVVVRAGHAAFIPGTKDFFIALEEHPEWGTAHTVFAEVDSMTVVDLITAQPYHEFTHPEHGTVMRMMNKEVPFSMDMELGDINPY